MAKPHTMTAARKAALRKAQMASARKRRGKGKGKLAKANRSATRNRRIAVVAATGGLALAAAGVAGAYYVRKTAGGGPKAKKMVYTAERKAVIRKAQQRSSALRNLPQIGKAAGPTPIPSRNLNPKIILLSRSKSGSTVMKSGTKRTRLRNHRRDYTSSYGSNHVWQL